MSTPPIIFFSKFKIIYQSQQNNSTKSEAIEPISTSFIYLVSSIFLITLKENNFTDNKDKILLFPIIITIFKGYIKQ